MDETKVHYGIAKAHQMMLMVNSCIESADLTSLDYLLSWKESRSDMVPDPTSGKSLLFVCLFVCFSWRIIALERCVLNNMKQLKVYICMPSLLGLPPFPLAHVITEHRAEPPVLSSSSPPAVSHMVVYVRQCCSLSVPTVSPSPTVFSSVLYICISIPALQI